VTTTPRNVGVLKELLKLDSTVVTHAKTEANAAHLAKTFLTEVRARYSGTSLGLQELDGVLLDTVDGALWTRKCLDDARRGKTPDLERVVVSVDPPAGDGKSSDACGIVVAGLIKPTVEEPGPRVQILEDASVKGLSPLGWAKIVADAAERWHADRIVAEVNQGGAMVKTLLHQVDPLLAVKAVHASRSKVARAEPVAGLYEQGRVFHAPGLAELEAQMCLMTPTGFEGSGSPDRVDALVWAVAELVGMRGGLAAPRFRTI